MGGDSSSLLMLSRASALVTGVIRGDGDGDGDGARVEKGISEGTTLGGVALHGGGGMFLARRFGGGVVVAADAVDTVAVGDGSTEDERRRRFDALNTGGPVRVAAVRARRRRMAGTRRNRTDARWGWFMVGCAGMVDSCLGKEGLDAKHRRVNSSNSNRNRNLDMNRRIRVIEFYYHSLAPRP